MRNFFVSFLVFLVLAGVAAVFWPWLVGPRSIFAPEPVAEPYSYSPPVSPPHQFARDGKAEPAAPESRPAADHDASGHRKLDWEDLIPPDWQPEALFADYDIDLLDDDDDLALELLDKLMAAWAEAPVVEELDGQLVKLPGFAVTLDAEPGKVGEFLLVPYFGACIHVPPPPANQTVYVLAADPEQRFTLDLFDTVWVIGTMRAQRFSGELAEAGYTIYAERVEPYQDDSSVLILE